MRKLIPILSLIFTVTLSSPSYAKWTMVREVSSGYVFVDLERIRKKDDGNIYFYALSDYNVKTKTGYLSAETYYAGDCKLFLYKPLTTVHHKEPMGRGTGVVSNRKNPGWDMPPVNSAIERVLKAVCAQ